MNRRKIKAIIVIFALAFTGAKSFATGYPVLDVANLMQSIEAVYQYYQQIQNTIEQVQNTYTQIEQAAQQMASMNWDDLKSLGDNFSGMGDNPFEVITGVRNSAQDITKAVNKNMNKINALQDSLSKESISFGGMDVSMADLVGAGDPDKNIWGFTKNAWDYTVGTTDENGNKVPGAFDDAIAGWEGKLTYKQKQKLMKKYGMSPKNYATLQLANYQLNEVVKNGGIMSTAAAQKQLLEDCENDANAIQTLAKNLPDGSVFAATQLVSSGLAQTERTLGNMHSTINSIFGFLTSKMKSDKTEEAVKEQQEADSKAFAENSTQSEGAINEVDDL